MRLQGKGSNRYSKDNRINILQIYKTVINKRTPQIDDIRKSVRIEDLKWDS